MRYTYASEMNCHLRISLPKSSGRHDTASCKIASNYGVGKEGSMKKKKERELCIYILWTHATTR
jgi:hypothetical protein